MGKGDALLNVALESVNGLLEVLVLLAGEVGQRVDGLLGTVGLLAWLAHVRSVWSCIV